jgi:hypothetical protein
MVSNLPHGGGEKSIGYREDEGSGRIKFSKERTS